MLQHFDSNRHVSSRTFVTKDEYLTRKLIAVKSLPTGSFLIKTPRSHAVLISAPFVKLTKLSADLLARAKAKIFSAPYYHSPELNVVNQSPPPEEPEKWRD